RLPLVILWSGLAAPPASLRPTAVQAGFFPGNTVFSLCVLGLYFLPFALVGATRLPRVRFVATGLAVLVLLGFIPGFEASNQDLFGGSLRSVLVTTTSAVGPVRNIVLAVLLVAGCQVVCNFCWPIAAETLPIRASQFSCLIGILMQASR